MRRDSCCSDLVLILSHSSYETYRMNALKLEYFSRELNPRLYSNLYGVNGEPIFDKEAFKEGHLRNL